MLLIQNDFLVHREMVRGGVLFSLLYVLTRICLL